MPQFGEKSKEKLEKCHPKLQKLFNEVIKYVDCTIIWGYKDETEQNNEYEKGLSLDKYPNSPHNKIPSKAIDVAMWFNVKPHVRWDDFNSWYFFAGFVLGIASQLKIRIRWGGDPEQNFIFDDTRENLDLMHFELDDIWDEE